MYEWMNRQASAARIWVDDADGGHYRLSSKNNDDLWDGDLFLILACFINPLWGDVGEDVWLGLVHANQRVSWHVFRWDKKNQYRRVDDCEIDSNAVLTRSPAI